MATKKKILFLMRDFVQAGAQRYQYEIIKALDKDKYDIDILTLLPIGSSRENGFTKEFYLPLLKEHVSNIFHLPILQSTENRLLRLTNNRHINGFKKVKFVSKVLNMAETLVRNNADTKLENILSGYDYINCTDYDFTFLKNIQFDINKLLVLVVTTKMQTFPNSPFKDFDPYKQFNFVVVWDEATDKIEFDYFKNGYNINRFALVIDTSIFKLIPYPKPSNTCKIGIFTRIDYQLKPLEPFFYALHLLRNRGVNVTVHIYGAGDPNGFNRMINTLSLQKVVIFEGHQEDLAECLEREKLHLAWFQANNYEPAGYAALETMGRGVPHVFWDFQPMRKHKPQGAMPYPIFWELEAFVNYTQFLLSNNNEAAELGEIQQKFVIENQDTKKRIYVLEDFYDKKAVKQVEILTPSVF